MKHLLAYVAVVALAGCAAAEQIRVTPEQVAQCEAEGGCALVTRMGWDLRLQMARQLGIAEGAALCRRDGL